MVRTSYGRADAVRIVRGHRYAGELRAGGSQPLVHRSLCRRLRAGLGLRIPAGRLAVRAGRGDLGRGGAAALEPQAAMTSLSCFRQAARPRKALYWCALRRWIKTVSTRDSDALSAWIR